MKKQLFKETLITIFVYLFYFLWWYYFAFIYPPKDPKDYTYILGLPSWFFYSCILGFVVINILVYLSIKLFFKEIDLETGDVIEE